MADDESEVATNNRTTGLKEHKMSETVDITTVGPTAESGESDSEPSLTGIPSSFDEFHDNTNNVEEAQVATMLPNDLSTTLSSEIASRIDAEHVTVKNLEEHACLLLEEHDIDEAYATLKSMGMTPVQIEEVWGFDPLPFIGSNPEDPVTASTNADTSDVKGTPSKKRKLSNDVEQPNHAEARSASVQWTSVIYGDPLMRLMGCDAAQMSLPSTPTLAPAEIHRAPGCPLVPANQISNSSAGNEKGLTAHDALKVSDSTQVPVDSLPQNPAPAEDCSSSDSASSEDSELSSSDDSDDDDCNEDGAARQDNLLGNHNDMNVDETSANGGALSTLAHGGAQESSDDDDESINAFNAKLDQIEIHSDSDDDVTPGKRRSNNAGREKDERRWPRDYAAVIPQIPNPLELDAVLAGSVMGITEFHDQDTAILIMIRARAATKHLPPGSVEPKSCPSAVLRALDVGTVLCTTEKKPIGAISEIIGQTASPLYAVQLKDAAAVEACGLSVLSEVFYFPEHAEFALPAAAPATDASGKDDKEVEGAGEEFSDDEKAKFSKTRGKKGFAGGAREAVEAEMAGRGRGRGRGAARGRGDGGRGRGVSSLPVGPPAFGGIPLPPRPSF